jgi:type II secretory pathway component PulM
MKSGFDQLNLRPFERRLVVGVGTVVFVVLNMVFVWPHFSDRSKAQEDLEGARRKLARFEQEIAQVPQVQAKMRELESAAEPVPEEDQGTEFLNTIQRQSSQSGISITTPQRMTTRTNNQFFIERNQTVSFVAAELQLLDFLHSLGTGGSMIRVRSLSLRPDAPRQRLTGNVTLVASYQKKQPPRAPAAAAATTTNKATPTLPPSNRPAVKSEKAAGKSEKAAPPSPAPAKAGSPPTKSTTKRP